MKNDTTVADWITNKYENTKIPVYTRGSSDHRLLKQFSLSQPAGQQQKAVL